MQGNKLRPADDPTESLVHRATSCSERVTVDGVDRMAAVVKLLARLLQHDDVQVAFASSQVLDERRHPGFKGKRGELVGKCLDLEACTQCPLARADRNVGVIAIDDPARSGELLYLVGFNRVATGLRQTMVMALFPHGVNYNDDFPIIIL